MIKFYPKKQIYDPTNEVSILMGLIKLANAEVTFGHALPVEPKESFREGENISEYVLSEPNQFYIYYPATTLQGQQTILRFSLEELLDNLIGESVIGVAYCSDESYANHNNPNCYLIVEAPELKISESRLVLYQS